MISDLEKYNFHIDEVKDAYDRCRELTRKVVAQEDRLRLAIQDKIIGAIDDAELEKITADTIPSAKELHNARMELYHWRSVLSQIHDTIDHAHHNACYGYAEIDTEIAIAEMFVKEGDT